MENHRKEEAIKAFCDLMKRSEALDSHAQCFNDAATWKIVKDSDNGFLRIPKACSPWPSLVKQMRNIQSIPASDGDAFLVYAGEDFGTHPWHDHLQIIQNIVMSVDDAIANLHQFSCETFSLYEYIGSIETDLNLRE